MLSLGQHEFLSHRYPIQRSFQLRIGSSPVLLLCRHSCADIFTLKIILAAHMIIPSAAALQAFSANIYAQAHRISSSPVLLLCRHSLRTSMQKHANQGPSQDKSWPFALQAFFADIYAEARKAKPGLGHRALAQVAGGHKLLRHYTMNIDGLAEAAGMDTWHVDNNPAGESQDHTVTCLSVRMLQFPLPPGDTPLYSQLRLMFGMYNDE